MYTEEIAYIKYLLNIEGVHTKIQWYHRRPVKRRGTTETWGTHFIQGDVHHLKIANYGSYIFTVETLAHELRHVWQFARGIAKWEEQTYVVWAGTEYAPEPKRYNGITSDYKNRPHEIDARAFAEKAVQCVIGKYGTHNEKLPTVKQSLSKLFQ